MIGLRKRTIKIMIYSIGLFLLGYTLAAIDVILTLRGSEIPAWLNDAGAILLAVSVSLGPLLFANYSYHFQQRVRELKKATRERIALLIGRAQQWALNQPAAPVPEPVTEIALQPLKSPIVHRTVTVQAHSSDQADNEINVPSCSTIPAVTHIMTRETLSTEHHKSLTWRITIGDKNQSENQICVPSCSTIPTVTHVMTRESLDIEHHKSLTWRITIGDKTRQCGITNFKSSFWRHYNTIHLVITYGIPLVISGIFYAISSCILCLLNRLSRDTAESTSSPSITSGIRVMIGLRKRTIKIMVSSIGLFLLGYTLAAIETIIILNGGELSVWLNDAAVILLTVSVSLGPLLFANYSYHFQQRVRELKRNTRQRIALLIGRVHQWVLNQPAAPVPEPVTEIALQPLKSPVVHRTVTVQAHSSDQAENEINAPSCSAIPTVTHVMTRESLNTEHHKSLTWRITIGDKSE
ncbi:hypothetical protein Ddc_10557 [Ditylenchus destructor]|nr:hypothetical protein Ddc_10557 [Ditylenchus destructor]